jgi:hypothetical protein
MLLLRVLLCVCAAGCWWLAACALLPPIQNHHSQSHFQNFKQSKFKNSNQTAGYFAYGALAERLGLPKLNARRRAAKKADAGAGAAAIDGDEWVKGTHYELQKRRRAAAAKRA